MEIKLFGVFLQKGGIKAQMYRVRTSSKYYQSNPTTRQSADTSNTSDNNVPRNTSNTSNNIVSRDIAKNIV